MLSENTLFYYNKKQKAVFGCQTCFLSFFILKNRKLFLKIVAKQESFHVSPGITLVIAHFMILIIA